MFDQQRAAWSTSAAAAPSSSSGGASEVLGRPEPQGRRHPPHRAVLRARSRSSARRVDDARAFVRSYLPPVVRDGGRGRRLRSGGRQSRARSSTWPRWSGPGDRTPGDARGAHRAQLPSFTPTDLAEVVDDLASRPTARPIAWPWPGSTRSRADIILGGVARARAGVPGARDRGDGRFGLRPPRGRAARRRAPAPDGNARPPARPPLRERPAPRRPDAGRDETPRRAGRRPGAAALRRRPASRTGSPRTARSCSRRRPAVQRRAGRQPRPPPPAQLLRDPQQRRCSPASPTTRSSSSPSSPATTASRRRRPATPSSPTSTRTTRGWCEILAGMLRIAVGSRPHPLRGRPPPACRWR